MQIHAIKEDEPSPFDQDAFAEELRTISDQFGFRLVSLGTVAMANNGEAGTMFLAVWSTGTTENSTD